MDNFLESVRQSLANRNWYAALYLSLTLPDICSRLESDDGKTSSKRYIAWFEKYLADEYKHDQGDGITHVFLSGNDCYALRCAMLHEGWPDITTQRLQETLSKIHFTVVGSHCIQVDSVLQLDVPQFCSDICLAVTHWMSSFKSNHKDKAYRLEDLVVVHVGSHGIPV
jgi:hypothetical protein